MSWTMSCDAGAMITPRVELEEDQPVADDVLDVVGGHREQAEQEVAPIVGNVERREAHTQS